MAGLAVACQGRSDRSGSQPSEPVIVKGPALAPPNAAPPRADIPLPPPVDAVPAGTFTQVDWMPDVQRVAVVERGGRAVVAAAGMGWLKLFDPSSGAELDHFDGGGVAQVLAPIDVDGDGADELIIARGRGRDAMNAGVTIQVFRAADLRGGAEVISMPQTTRAQVIEVVGDPARPGRVWVGMFDSKYFVTYFEATRDAAGTWSVTALGKGRVAADLAAGDIDGDGVTDLIAAQMYGETAEEPGGAYVLGEGGARTVIPSTRGARGLAIVNGAVVLTDGWDKNYGRDARALVSLAVHTPAGWKTTTLANVKGRYGYDRLCIADLDGDGDPDAVAAGHGPAIAVRDLRPVQDAVVALGEADAQDVACGDLDRDGADEVVIAGPTPGIWRAKAAPGNRSPAQ